MAHSYCIWCISPAYDVGLDNDVDHVASGGNGSGRCVMSVEWYSLLQLQTFLGHIGTVYCSAIFITRKSSDIMATNM